MPINIMILIGILFLVISFCWFKINSYFNKNIKENKIKKNIFNVIMVILYTFFLSSTLSFFGVPGFQEFGPMSKLPKESYNYSSNSNIPPKIINKVERSIFNDIKEDHKNSLEDWKKN